MAVLILLLQAATAESVAREVHVRFLEGKWEAALEAYRKMPDPPPHEGAEPRAVLDYQIRRAEAHWEAAQCRARLGRWEEARQAFSDARTRWRRPSFCGNGVARIGVEGAVAEGICLERLGRHREAAELYLGVAPQGALTSIDRAASRVVELYAAAGALDVLEGRMTLMDQDYWKKIMVRYDDPEKRLDLMRYAPAASLRTFYEAARAAGGVWRPSRETSPAELPFPPIPKDLKLP